MIDLAEWKRQLATPELRVELDGNGEEITELFILTNETVKCTSLTISNTIFISGLHISNLSFPGNITLQKCKANQIRLHNVTLATDPRYAGGFLLYNSEVHVDLEIIRYSTERGRIDIWGCTIQQLTIRDAEINGIHLSLRNSSFYRLNLERITANKIELDHLDISQHPYRNSSRYLIVNCATSELSLSQCILSYITFEHLEIKNALRVYSSIFDQFFLQHIAYAFELICKDCEFKSIFIVSPVNKKSSTVVLTAIRLINCDLGKTASIIGNKALPLKELVLSGTKITDSVLTVSELKIELFRLEYDRAIHTLQVKNVEFHRLEMISLRNNGEIYFSEVKPYGDDSSWRISRAQLGDWHMNGCDIRSLNYFDVVHSELSGLRYSSVGWHYHHALYPPELRDEKQPRKLKKNPDHKFWKKVSRDNVFAVEARNRREIYRMLKEAAENQKDRICSLRFQQDEMYEHSQYLRLTRNFWSRDRIVLWAGRSNDHGLNWSKPVLLAVAFSVPFFVLIVIGGDPDISISQIFQPHTWKIIAQHYGLFPQLLNPVHSLDKMFASEAIHPATWWFDYLHRLLMAFFIVQTVAAFRKFMRA